MSVIKIRPAIDIENPQRPLPLLPDHFVRFHHPGYPSQGRQDVLFGLYGFDCADGGIHYGTAWLACVIVAGNAWEGYLSETRDGPRLEEDFDNVLRGRDYWFHVPPAPEPTESTMALGSRLPSAFALPPGMIDPILPYPTVPTFQDWEFPHDRVPREWYHQEELRRRTVPGAPSNLTGTVQARDRYCRITQCSDRTEAAHICPRADRDWFKRNGMANYNTNPELVDEFITDDESNAFLLRSDLHTDFDSRKFVFVPKRGKWVTHALKVTNELGRLYHNVATQDISSAPPAFLLARFAWAIFPHLRGFLVEGARRHLIRLRTIDGETRWVKEMADGADVRSLADNGPKSRSASPNKGTKRSRSTAQDDEDTRGEIQVDDRDEKMENQQKTSRTLTNTINTSHAPPTNLTLKRKWSPKPLHASSQAAAELAEDLTLFHRIFPSMPISPSREVVHSDDYVWQRIAVYPGYREVARTKRRWREERKEEGGGKQTWDGDEEERLGDGGDGSGDEEFIEECRGCADCYD